jgi:hypothetical protein
MEGKGRPPTRRALAKVGFLYDPDFLNGIFQVSDSKVTLSSLFILVL